VPALFLPALIELHVEWNGFSSEIENETLIEPHVEWSGFSSEIERKENYAL
jgi:hypothetical protein